MIYTSKKFYFNGHERSIKNWFSTFDLLEDIKRELIGKIIFGRFFSIDKNNLIASESENKIIEVKNVSYVRKTYYEKKLKFVSLRSLVSIFQFIDKDDKEYYTHSPNFLIVSDLLEYFNNKKSNVLFYGVSLNIKHRYDIIKKIFGLSLKYAKDKLIEVKLKEIYHKNDKLFIIGENGITYEVYNPNNIITKIISNNDPYGEENWDD